MSEQNVKVWQQKKRAVEDAKKWQELPDGPKYEEGRDTFHISVAHSKPPMLSRMGQQSVGGQNYWETDSEFNSAILEYLISNWSAIYPEVLNIMQAKENKALLDLEQYVKSMQDLINQAK